VNLYVAFGFDCTGRESNLNDCREPGATCRFDDPSAAVAIRCGSGEYVPETGPTSSVATLPPIPQRGTAEMLARYPYHNACMFVHRSEVSWWRGV
jgi:hypothetical protein